MAASVCPKVLINAELDFYENQLPHYNFRISCGLALVGHVTW